MPGILNRGARAIATAVVVTLAISACGDDADSGSSDARRRAGTSGPPPIGDPRAALPEPARLHGGSSTATAVMLAQEVRGGGESGAAALLEALRLSGIGVRGPDGALTVKPVQPVQGTMIEAWEIRPLVALARDERPVLIQLGEVAMLMRSVMPELADVPIEQHILDGVRRHATDSASPLAFWANFVNALGGSHPVLGEPDLLSAGEPRSVVVNGLQASLILRRLGTDLLVRAHPPAAHSALLTPLRWLSPEPLYAADAPRPCTLTPTQQTIMDLDSFASGVLVGGAKVGDLGFSGLLEGMEKYGKQGAKTFGNFTKVAGVVLAYGQFIATYGALEADIELDQSTLPRTKELSPQTGERRNLVASIHFDTGDEQAANCFRGMLNTMGLDFTVPQNGPVKGAKVAWAGMYGFDQAAEALHGGPEAIVQFVDDPANRIQDGAKWEFSSGNAIVNQTTDENGSVHIGVEGRGQSEPVPDGAGRVVREATVGVQVAVKGADIFGDLKDASSTALGGLPGLLTIPLEILYRMKWATVGTLTFPVLDWGEGKGWSGWVDVTVRGSGQQDGWGGLPMKSKSSRFTSVRFDFVNGRGTWTGRETGMLVQSTPTTIDACAMGPKQTRTVASGSGLALLDVEDAVLDFDELPASYRDASPLGGVDFAWSTDGQSAVGVDGIELAGRETGTFIACEFPNGVPRRVIKPYNEELTITHIPLGSSYGSFPDPSKETALRGSLTSPFEDEESGFKGVIATRWQLRRTQ